MPTRLTYGWPTRRSRWAARPRRTPISTFPSFFFFKDTAATELYTLSLHDALPIPADLAPRIEASIALGQMLYPLDKASAIRSEEHTSELQSLTNLVCRLLLEK